MQTVRDYRVHNPIGTSKTQPLYLKLSEHQERGTGKIYEPGAREIAQQFRADTVLTEDTNIIPNTHQEAHKLILFQFGFCQTDKTYGHLRRGNHN